MKKKLNTKIIEAKSYNIIDYDINTLYAGSPILYTISFAPSVWSREGRSITVMGPLAQQDVQKAIQWANENDIDVQRRSVEHGVMLYFDDENDCTMVYVATAS